MRDLATKALQAYRSHGISYLVSRGVPYVYDQYIREPRRSLISGITSRYRVGTHVLSRDWDVLILLDGCRVDALQAVADEYAFIHDIDRIWSVGGATGEWMTHTFDRQWEATLNDVIYLTGNPHAKTILENEEKNYSKMTRKLYRYGNWNTINASELAHLEHVWEYELPDYLEEWTHIDRRGHIPPQLMTDRAVTIGRDRDFERLILHYTQPHQPYVTNAVAEQRALYEYESAPWVYLRRTNDRETVFNAYLDELRYVLDSIETLLTNLDAEKVVISADHGDAFGERGIYGHQIGSLHPPIRFVPWVETTATDAGTYFPDFESSSASKQSTGIEEKLEALGYKT